MLFQKKGFPEEGELVLCTTSNVQSNSVFVKLDEYGSSGMIHISEISPGRIRNIRDYVKEGKKIVCVVLRIHPERGHIDLSLRRVNETQKKNKVEHIKQLQKAEKIVEFVANNNKINTEVLFKEIIEKIKQDYDDLVVCFNDVVNNGLELSKYNISLSDELETIVKQRIKPPEVIIEGDFSIELYSDDGISIIKEIFSKLDGDKIKSCYLGGGRYQVSVKAPNYKEAEEILEPVKQQITKFLESKGAKVEYKRHNKKK
jgi:translation initiation factor 2 subunit 1